jgi:DNA-binding transcriptional LysR family regulator
MAKAAADLAVSQPAVSKAIAEMEHTLGVRLLDRTAQGVDPTLYGRALLQWSVAVFDDLRQGVNEIEFLADPTVGELRIGATEPIVAGLLPVIITRLTRQHQGLTFHITQVPTIPLYRDLRERNVDVVIGRILNPKADEDFHTEILFDEPQFVVAGLDNPWIGRRKIKLAELIDEPWSLPRLDSAAGTLIAETFRACRLEVPRIRVISNSIHMHNALLANGRFLAMFPRSLLQFSAKRLSIKVLPVELPTQPAPIGIVTLKNRTISPVAQLFIDCAREVARPLAKTK